MNIINALSAIPEVCFNTNPVNDDLNGELVANILFVQNSIIPQGRHIAGDIQPHLTANRKTMVLFKPAPGSGNNPSVVMRVENAAGSVVGRYTMLTPEKLTRPVALDGIIYGEGFWSAILPATLIEPGIKLEFEHNGKMGSLHDITVGAPSELIIHTIDLGMLTPFRGHFTFQSVSEYHRQYFHQIPVKKLVVSRYEPQYFTEVMLPDGRLLKDYDPSTGGIYDGTMRQRIGKELISLGIDNANYGINSSKGTGEDSHPYSVAQLAAHNSVGKYVNGIIVHGLSGGGGIVTLEDSVGNEFSHEVGHNFGLGHYEGDFAGSIHNRPSEVNSCWGWDSDNNAFIPNVENAVTNLPTCQEGICAAPFEGHSFGRDAMAGGKPLYKDANNFTLYTPYVLNKAQIFLENKAVFDAASPTGFKKWNATDRAMVPWINTILSDPASGREVKIPFKQGVSVVTLVGYYDPFQIMTSYMYPPLHGSYGMVYPSDGETSNQCYIEVQTQGNGNWYFRLAYIRFGAEVMNKFHINFEARLNPVRATLFIKGKSVASMDIGQATERSLYTINGHEFNNGYPATLLNASAESGDLSGWTLDKGQFRVVTGQDNILAAEGDSFFTARSGGYWPDNNDRMSQQVALDTVMVSSGKTVATLTFKSNGWGDGDYGEVWLIARNRSGIEVGRTSILSIHAKGEWTDNRVSLELPIGAATLIVEVNAYRLSGTTSDVHFDQFELNVERVLPAALQNPSAETGNLNGWKREKGEFRTIAMQDDIHAADGNYFFTGRNGGDYPDNHDRISQEVALDTVMVSAGKALATLRFQSNGWGDGDYGEVWLIARDQRGVEVSKTSIRSVHNLHKWTDNRVSLELPIGAATLIVEVNAYRFSGTTSDVHFDQFELNVERVLPTALQNPSAETGNLNGWKREKGQFRAIVTQDDIYSVDGNYFFTGRNGGSYPDNNDRISQEVALDADVVSTGKAVATLRFQSNGWGDGDYGEVWLIARDQRGVEVSRTYTRSIHNPRKWTDNRVSLDLPINTATLGIEVNAFRLSGTTSDVHFDNFILNVK